MKILITNDDGVHAPGLLQLTEWARDLGEVIVVAPKTEQSGKSHSIDIRNRLVLAEEEPLVPGVPTYSLTSTPADCVRFALYGLNYDFDIVFSGINDGWNIAEDIAYSGTVAAAMEAAMLGKQAIAFSMKRGDRQAMCALLAKAWEQIQTDNLLKLHNCWSVNFPEKGTQLAYAEQGSLNYTTYFKHAGDCCGGYLQGGIPDLELDVRPASDVHLIATGHITLTPINYLKTAHEILKKVRK